MAWTYANTTKTAVTKNWMDETRAAIITHDGIELMTSSGVTISFSTDFSAISAYMVLRQWEASAVTSAGTLDVSKVTGSCTIRAVS